MTILNKVISGEKITPPPIWLMRQAGRYLPEYRKVRSESGSFLNLCYSPKLASEVTLQPIDRFDFDAAIIFADILLIVENLGFNLHFNEKKGPVIENCLINQKQIIKYQKIKNSPLLKIGETVSLTRKKLEKNKSLIGFCGAPWTVATYIINGGTTTSYEKCIQWAHDNYEYFMEMINLLVEISSEYLIMQIEAGADIIKIFDTWSGVLNENDFNDWVIIPTHKIAQNIKTKYPHIKIIGFPKNCGYLYEDYIKKTSVDAVAVDPDLDMLYCKNTLQKLTVIQGNISPEVLRIGGDTMKKDIIKTLDTFGDYSFIMGLGHGVLKDTPVNNVLEFVDIVRKYKRI
ncbi:MAG: uroporphyrinogen decarboxylase [Rhodobiaceae bacterium]|nr:uroporphyrinogen decarboxylase [Rhodobiaceae bacterium]